MMGWMVGWHETPEGTYDSYALFTTETTARAFAAHLRRNGFTGVAVVEVA